MTFFFFFKLHLVHCNFREIKPSYHHWPSCVLPTKSLSLTSEIDSCILSRTLCAHVYNTIQQQQLLNTLIVTKYIFEAI